MLKFFPLACLLAITLNFMSCEKGKIKNIDSIGYGTSFGMCIGYCLNSISVNNEKVTFSKTKHGSTPDTKTCTSTISAAEAKILKDLLDDSKIASLPKTIGCPDCADGGAEWVSVTSGTKEYKVVFEYGKAPKELAPVVTKLRVLKETFNNCN
jgi:hypothetical protein